MSFSIFLRLLSVAVVTALMFLSSINAVAAEQRKPNVVVFLSDDQGWGDLSVNGNSNLATPNIDQLAKDGAQFDWFYVCRVCAPTRAEFLTGRFHARGGVRGVSTGQERLNIDEMTIAQTFKAAGYATGAFGKWHNGMQHPYHPNARGFDEYYGFCSGHWGNYFDPVLDHNNKLVRGKGYIIDDFTNHAIQFIEDNKEQPFFCYLPYCTPHSPMQVPESFFEKHDGQELELRHRDPKLEDVQKTRAALAMCENIDWNVGRVLEKLEELNLTDDTIVVYFTDNGPNSYRFNGGMKGRKGSLDEGGVRTACFIKWPGKIAAGTEIHQVSAAIDFLPTLADMAGISVQSVKPLDGMSLKSRLLGKKQDPVERMYFSMKSKTISVRSQKYRLDSAGRLYDIANDIGQHNDIAQQHPEQVAKMKKAASSFLEEVSDQLTPDDRPFTVGHSLNTPLPARDGVAHGNVKRSARAPNCSYFTNWTSETDKISWDIEVAESGTYEAIAYYTCPKNDVGSTVQLSFNGESITTKIDQPHDPPAYGRERDYSPRGSESEVKKFKPLSLGQFKLKKGRGELALTASDIPGDQVMEVRYIWLNRVDK